MSIMLCKEEICNWFRTLTADKRIDLMCGLLHMCLPLELRFIGSCVEDLARKNFHYLREKEIKANDRQEWLKSTDLSDPETRAKLNIYAALLQSANRLCSNILFSTLTRMDVNALLGLPTTLNSVVGQELLLLLTLAANHPAFTFNQRQILCELLQSVARIIGDNIVKPSVCMHSIHLKPEDRHSGNLDLHVSTADTTNCATNTERKVFIENIDLKRSQWRSADRRHEFHLQVTWSDGKIEECVKTYHDLQTFHTELIRLFPKDSGAHKQDRHIPFLPQDRLHSHGSDFLEQIKKYLKLLAALPDHIVQCDHVTSFFASSSCLQSPSSSASSSPRSASTALGNANTNGGPQKSSHSPRSNISSVDDEDPVTASGHVKSLTIYNSHIDNGVKKVAGNNNNSNSNRSPRHHSSQPAGSSSATNNRHNCSQADKLSTPHMSPVSSSYHILQHATLSPPASSSAATYKPVDMAVWLRNMRLHKYTGQLSKFTFEELLMVKDSELEKLGLTVGARKKLHNEIDIIKKSVHRPNGLVTDSPSRSLSPSSSSAHRAPSSGSSVHSSPRHSSSAPTPHQFAGSVVSSSMDSSTSCSDCSPPASPEPDHTRSSTEIFSDDMEKVGDQRVYRMHPLNDMPKVQVPQLPTNEFVPIPALNSAPTMLPYRASIQPVIPTYVIPDPTMGIPPPGMPPYLYGHTVRSPRPLANHLTSMIDVNVKSPGAYPTHVADNVNQPAVILPQGGIQDVPSVSTSIKTMTVTTVNTVDTVHVKTVTYNTTETPPSNRPSTLNVNDNTSSVSPKPVNLQMNTPTPSISAPTLNNNSASLPPTSQSQIQEAVPKVTNGAVLLHANKQEALYPATVREGVYPVVVAGQEGTFVMGRENVYPAAVSRENVYPAAVSRDNVYPAAVSRDNVYPAAVSRDNIYPAAVSRENIYPLPAGPREPVMSPSPVRETVYPPAQPVVPRENNVYPPTTSSSRDNRYSTPPPPPSPSSQNQASVSYTSVIQNPYPPSHPTPMLANNHAGGLYASVYTVTQPSTSITYTVPSSYSSGMAPRTPSTPSSNSNFQTCSTCGCHCSLSMPPSSSNNPMIPTPSPHFNYGMCPSPMFHGIPQGFLPPNSNGLISSSLAYPSAMALNLPNGLTADMLYASQSSIYGLLQQHLIAQHNQAFLASQNYNSQAQFHSQALNNPASLQKLKTPMCYNCGMQGHRANECKEPTMDLITRQGQFHLNITPKSDSE